MKIFFISSDGKFLETGAHFWFPDDVTLGFIIGETTVVSYMCLFLCSKILNY